MKKKVQVIRSANKTVVIYSEPTKARGAKEEPVIRQKPVPVYHDGKFVFYIMPDGRYIPRKVGAFWKVLKFIRPNLQYVV